MKYTATPTALFRAAIMLLATCVIMLSSCSKSDSSTTNSNSTTQLLTASNWTLQSEQVEESNGTWIANPDSPGTFTLQFSNNSKFSIYQGASMYEGYTWYIGNGLVLTGSFLQGTYTINTLTTSTLELTEQNYPTGGTYTGERLTFTH